ncbi:uncharacterized protein NEMAJ01_1163 [Nematocida major]|uniref:uncharacterized protein n=1 Tax=Nematocida major TaxID=1912982 RepID=UPI00200893B3|nr:uncharacterized protein NEMAJ01_1163 [Nematocida major]KAH9386267.1 hypothetical protein NEMAJ01_1163 [Nematocida major]
MKSSEILGMLGEIKERLHNLQKQRMHIPNRRAAWLPFCSALDVLQKIAREEEYLHAKAAELKERLPMHAKGLGKTCCSPEVHTMMRPDTH